MIVIYFVEDEVTVFFDVAHTTLGGDDLESEQTHSLLNVLTGYTPFLFEFNQEQADLASFLNLCQRVWKNLEANPHLSSNLVSRNVLLSTVYLLSSIRPLKITHNRGQFMFG